MMIAGTSWRQTVFEREIVETLVDHLNEYHRQVVVSYYMALKLERFVVLSGPPDVDKMRLAEGLAEVLAGTDSVHRCLQWRLFQAHPWWTSHAGAPGPLAEIHNRFNSLRMLDTIEAAAALETRGLPLFVGLERMSPAEVVQYFEDLPRGLLWLPDASVRRVRLPGNLYVTGTIDMGAESAASERFPGNTTAIHVGGTRPIHSGRPAQRSQRRSHWQRAFAMPARDAAKTA